MHVFAYVFILFFLTVLIEYLSWFQLNLSLNIKTSIEPHLSVLLQMIPVLLNIQHTAQYILYINMS